VYTDFEYANKRLSDFGCIMCSINDSSGEAEIETGCDITFTSIKNGHTYIQSKTSTTYDNVCAASFDIIKYDCLYDSDIRMDSLEIRALMKWLNRHDYYKFKPLNDTTFESDVYYFGSFNVTEVAIGEDVIGLRLTFTSNAPYGFTEPINLKYMMLDTSSTVSAFGSSDEYCTILPKIEIKCFSDGDFEIKNQTSGTSMNIKNCKLGEKITIDGEHKIIISNMREQTEIANDFNYEYLDIMSNEDSEENIYSSSLPCELSMTYVPIRKIGVN
jgi:hypothetical protein